MGGFLDQLSHYRASLEVVYQLLGDRNIFRKEH